MDERSYLVPGMSCSHCKEAIEHEVSRVAGVTAVEASPETKLVVVRGASLDDAALRAAIDEAGYEAT
jgi:copper chaperone CopZ